MRLHFPTSVRRSLLALGRLRCQNTHSFVVRVKPTVNFQRLRHTYNALSEKAILSRIQASNGVPVTDVDKAIELLDSYAAHKRRRLMTQEDLEEIFDAMQTHYMEKQEKSIPNPWARPSKLDTKFTRPSYKRLLENYNDLKHHFDGVIQEGSSSNPWFNALVYKHLLVAANETGISAEERKMRLIMAYNWRQKSPEQRFKPDEEQEKWMDQNLKTYLRRARLQMPREKELSKIRAFVSKKNLKHYTLWTLLVILLVVTGLELGSEKVVVETEGGNRALAPARVRGELPSQASKRLGRGKPRDEVLGDPSMPAEIVGFESTVED